MGRNEIRAVAAATSQSNLINPINNEKPDFDIYIIIDLFCSINFHTMALEFNVQI